MIRFLSFLLVAAWALSAQEPDSKQLAQEKKDAEAEGPQLAEVLGLRAGMTVADVGAGFGAMTAVVAKLVAPGRVVATDVGERQLRILRGLRLGNVTVIEGGAESTNLPAGCCDAIFLRLVYHHVGSVEPFNRSLAAALKPGGRLAIIDSAAVGGSKLPAGVPANRGGHGVPVGAVVEEIVGAGLRHVRTIEKWPPGEKAPGYLVLFEK